MRVPPTACPVVAPGSGILNIMTRKLKAADMERSGTLRASNVAFTFFAAMVHRGIHAAYPAMYVGGPRYPSGMCMGFSYYLDSDGLCPSGSFIGFLPDGLSSWNARVRPAR
jgi:hypothetical protein